MSFPLDTFALTQLSLDYANEIIATKMVANAADAYGRGIDLTVTDHGSPVDLTGLSIYFIWRHSQGAQGTNSFEITDAANGRARVYYPAGMMAMGTVTARISIALGNDVITGSRNFKITVEPNPVDSDDAMANDDFSAFVEAMQRIDDNITDEVDAWLTAHPEATTTVEDGAVTTAKLADGAVTDAKLVQDGIIKDVAAHSNVLMVPEIEARSRESASDTNGLWIHPVDFNGHDLTVRISDEIELPDGYFFFLTTDWYVNDTQTLTQTSPDRTENIISGSHEVVIPQNPTSNVDGLYAAVGISLFIRNDSSQNISLQTTGYESFVTISQYDCLRGDALKEVANAYATDGEVSILALAPFVNAAIASGAIGFSRARAVNAIPIELSDSVTLSVDDGYRFGVHTYASDGSFSSDSGWQYGRYTVPANTQFRMVIARTWNAETINNYLAWEEIVSHVHVARDENVASTAPSKMWITSAHRGYVPSGSGLHENTLAAFYMAAQNGAGMIEMDARLTSDGVLVSNHDETVTGTNALGDTVTYTIANETAETICSVILSQDATYGTQYVPTLEQVLNLAYNTGMDVNIDMKNGYSAAEEIAKTVWKCGMRGHVVYALCGSGMPSINKILELDPLARFIDTPQNFTAESLSSLDDYESRCFAYLYMNTASASDIAAVKNSGCMLALINLTASNFATAVSYHPEMCEFPHTSDFRTIEGNYFNNLTLY